MASVSGMPPMLSLKRSGQSGSYALTAAWQVVYTESSIMAYLFGGATLDFSTMLAGDTIDIRVRKVVVPGGGWTPADYITLDDARPTNFQSIPLSTICDVYGVEVAMRQTAGVLRTIPCEFFDAKRLGLG